MEMNEHERKFIILSRIAVLLSRKNFTVNVGMNSHQEYSDVWVHYYSQEGGSSEIVEHFNVCSKTESELLEWHAEIERV